MTDQNKYRIEAGDIEMGIYEGADKQEALVAYAKDAGYKDYADLVDQHGKVDSIEEV